MIVVDTTVVVAAALPGHESHDAAVAALGDGQTQMLAHVAVEAYSVLTRLPPPQQVAGPVALHFLNRRFRLPPLVLPAAEYDRLLDLAAGEGITGGAIYDALVGMTARAAGATLLSLDRRAVPTYQLIGVDYRLVG